MGRNAQFIKRLYENFATGDVAAVLEAISPDLEWNGAANAYLVERSPHRSPEAIVEGVFTRTVGDATDLVAHPQRFTDGGDTVVVEGRYQGRAKSTGAYVDAQFVHVWGLDGGKITSLQQFTYAEQWARALRRERAGGAVI